MRMAYVVVWYNQEAMSQPLDEAVDLYRVVNHLRPCTSAGLKDLHAYENQTEVGLRR
jgi:hypothetical protein